MDPKAGGGEEDDCVDSGAETGGSDHSLRSSTSSELSLEEAQDPFLVSIHVIADPGEGRPLQAAIDQVLAWIHPDLQLFRVSERGASRRRKRPPKAAQPALAVVLFLQEEYGEERILQLHSTLQRPPWRLHHTERVQGRLLPYLPCSQDFFALAPGTPLWAIRPVHCGREIVRFTLYCRHENYADLLAFYRLILRRSPSRRKADFCVFPIFSTLDVDIQFSLKRLPRGQAPIPAAAAVLEVRVRDIGELVPLLPHPCSPISEGRWQTQDHDGNSILLQAQRVRSKCPKPRGARPCAGSSSPAPLSPGAAPGHLPSLPASPGLPPAGPQDAQHGPPWAFQRSKSLFCLPAWRPGRVPTGDTWEGAQETDVDTGLRLSSSDLSVVSAYSAPSRFCGSAGPAPPREGRGGPQGAGAPRAPPPLPAAGTPGPAASPAAPPSVACTPTPPGPSPGAPGGAAKGQPAARGSPAAPAPPGPGDGDVEEFYI
ncbi:protein FAM124A isoform X1 [Dasypus novemcinctus]|uniref:protein FAM124A isoform X1 n=1 Tax=Dasypus novemcinctus TaxID=9361 RepID=UPI00265E588A|nr:protein FAM124A isoform X1 [Dasypus novemcinctus]